MFFFLLPCLLPFLLVIYSISIIISFSSQLVSNACWMPATSSSLSPFHLHSVRPRRSVFFTTVHNFLLILGVLSSYVKAHYVYETPVSPAGLFSISPLLSHGFGTSSNLCVWTENSEMKVEWTLLTAPVCKSSPDQVTYVVPRKGPRRHIHCDCHVTVGLAVSLWCVTTDWE
jgi:hypothetical protein